MFDSGFGGLTVARAMIDLLPAEDLVYIGDTGPYPYGSKPLDDVRSYAHELAWSLVKDYEAKAVVVACNTATSVAIADLRKRYAIPIIGMEPAVKPALAKNKGKKILVLATSLTLRESKLETLITRLDASNRVERRELDNLVTFAEHFAFDTPEVQAYLQSALADIEWSRYETAVLGCTHFIYYRTQIQTLAGKHVQLIDGNEGTVKHLVNTVGHLRSAAPASGPRIAFYASGQAESPERVRRLMTLLS
jgi:glutamate racemase